MGDHVLATKTGTCSACQGSGTMPPSVPLDTARVRELVARLEREAQGAEAIDPLEAPTFAAVGLYLKQIGEMMRKSSEALSLLVEERDRLAADLARIAAAVAWALGEGDSDFGSSLPENRAPGDGKFPRIGRYWWRTELRERAFGRAALNKARGLAPQE